MKKGEYCLILYYPHPPFFFLQINEWNTLREELEELIAGIILGIKAVCRGILQTVERCGRLPGQLCNCCNQKRVRFDAISLITTGKKNSFRLTGAELHVSFFVVKLFCHFLYLYGYRTPLILIFITMQTQLEHNSTEVWQYHWRIQNSIKRGVILQRATPLLIVVVK